MTKGSHLNMSVVYIVQNLFDKGKHHRTISLNTHYLVCFKNPRDSTPIQTLARQIFPGRSHLVLEAFALDTDQAYGYLFFESEDLEPLAFSIERWGEEKELEA